MATVQLRPLSFGEILDASFSVYRRIFGTLVAIAIVCQGIPSVLEIYLNMAGGVIYNPVLWLITLILGAVAALFSFGASLRAISEAYLGGQPTVGGALRYALRKAWRLFVSGVAAYLLILLASLLFLIPGVIVAAGYTVVPQVAVLEELRASTDALGRSWRLTKGFKWRAFGLIIVSFVIVYAPIFAIWIIGGAIVGFGGALDETGAGGGSAMVIISVVASLAWLALYPILNCVFTLFYYDLRVRKEGFDLEHLSQLLGEGRIGS